ncbi:hypothetical protein [Parvularcula marina]|uniref:Uncharacterized protein n=1 Tax=Parvularcula marina TaxID=2292771 RepID=A0A371RG48_9PROT|nr:hypothetical protein [Parvularcula marina]RFB04427.1 hypothetical protein DX908_03465 [Parvularcula marina]
MARINYGHEGGSPIRWLVGIFLAVILAVVVVAGARIGAENVCGGACEPLSAIAEFLRQPFPVLGDTLTWCMGLAIACAFLLWIALGSRQHFLAAILILALALLGASMAGVERKDAVSNEPEDIPDVATTLDTAPKPRETDTIVIGSVEAMDPVADLLPEPEPLPDPALSCPAGNFWNGEGCSTCEVATSVPVSAKISFIPATLEASWDYADARHVRLGTGADMLPVADVTVNGTAPCDRDAILVIGSSSSDGPLPRNLDRARRRAVGLADHMRASCETAPQIFALSIGQSTAERDNFKDRALTVIGLDAAPGEVITQALVEEELGYILGNGEATAPLLTRIDYFPKENWVWIEGGEGSVNVTPAPRPYEKMMTLREGAPASCGETS